MKSIDNLSQTQPKNMVSNTSKSHSNKLNENPKNIEQQEKVHPERINKKLKENVEELNSVVEMLDRDIKFKVHKDTNRIMTQIVDTKNDEVIRELPPEEMLDMIARIQDMVGLIINEKV